MGPAVCWHSLTLNELLFMILFLILIILSFCVFVEFDEPEALIVLLEEELVAIDLLSDDWQMLSLPYLVSLHASAVTCAQHVSGIPQELYDHIVAAGRKQTQDMYSDRVSYCIFSILNIFVVIQK